MIVIFKYFVWLILYSFMGWVYESLICSITSHRVVNRGFLYGPICPIYGFGALSIIVLFYGRTESIFILFVGGMFLSIMIEYITAILLEKFFHNRWWDYSDYRFNIRGKICLKVALVFGCLSVVVIRYIHPWVVEYTDSVSNQSAILVSIFLFVIVMIDMFLTVYRLKIKNMPKR